MRCNEKVILPVNSSEFCECAEGHCCRLNQNVKLIFTFQSSPNVQNSSFQCVFIHKQHLFSLEQTEIQRKNVGEQHRCPIHIHSVKTLDGKHCFLISYLFRDGSVRAQYAHAFNREKKSKHTKTGVKHTTPREKMVKCNFYATNRMNWRWNNPDRRTIHKDYSWCILFSCVILLLLLLLLLYHY